MFSKQNKEGTEKFVRKLPNFRDFHRIHTVLVIGEGSDKNL